ncbi:DUF4124 domain-containing protein [Variovorax sp. J22P168]|uniref:DUF4124 domain-containing protein n=1 Tax=Variovorax jilinensis TaxID=3053513 RepID=UPI002576F68E|nr:DUF4124 domain-containing protein [Variovorax sp. J22P168]MDM0013331.1 DUF4124 domain-containing protein [Variovorax sp. J22P168]
MKLASLLLIGSVLLLPLGAHAQWQWIDKDNKKVFSDQAPPPDVPEKNILRRPTGPSKRVNVTPPAAAGDAAAADPAAAAAAPRAPVPGAKPAGVDKELEEKTRKAEEAEKARQAAETQKQAQAKADNCNRARQAKATMDSGIRVARVNANGEREIIDDSARASEQRRLQGVIDADCK